MSKLTPYKQIGAFLRLIGHPVRLRILHAIGTEEVCVCHLEATLGLRQAYLSQHLMAMRDAGVIQADRDGRYIYYRLSNPEILAWINACAELVGVPLYDLEILHPKAGACECPKCCKD